MTSSVSVASHLAADWATDALHGDITRTFSNTPKLLRPKWLYDDQGSQLFDQITRLPEYYPTEAERGILASRAAQIARRTGADTVVELGSGTSDKTRTLLDAFWETGQLRRFVPLDVSEQTLVDAAQMLARRYDGLEVSAVVGDFTQHLRHIPTDGQRLVAFLGGTLGNFYQEERRAFLGHMADTLEVGEWLLLGVDLMKETSRIIDAYYDSQAVTEAFIKNVLHVLNRELGGDISVDHFDYVPLWDPREERVDMRLRATEPMTVRLNALDLETTFAEGEELRVEISTKFRPTKLRAELAEAGFAVHEFWTAETSEDGHVQDGDFGLVLAQRAP